MSPARRQSGRPVVWIALAGSAGVALLLRCLGWADVFVGDGVIFALGDPYYHLRLARFALERFPETLVFDPYMNFPDGSFVTWPPLYDLLVAGLTLGLGGGSATLERVAALLPPLLATATLLPVYALGRMLRGAGTGVGAAALFALLPISVSYSRIGNADHHAWVALLGACLLALYVAALRAPAGGRRPGGLGVGLALARAALLGSWGGSLLYLLPGETLLLATGAVTGARRLLALQAWSLLASAALVLPLVVRSAAPSGGPFSAVELSWLHPTLCVLGAACAAGWIGLERTRPARGPAARVARLGALGVVAALALLALPEVRAGLARALGFLGKRDVWGPQNLEQAPLFAQRGAASAGTLWGAFAWVIPLAPLGPLLRARQPALRAPALAFAAWAALFGSMAVAQVRYGNEFAPAAAVCFALLGAELAALCARAGVPAALRVAFVMAGAALLLRTPLERVYVPELRVLLTGPPAAGDAALRTPHGTLVRFAERVRAATPETAGFLDPELEPEYGVACAPSLGHVLHYVARRPTPANNFGPYVGEKNFALNQQLFEARSEATALALLESLGARYVVTNLMTEESPDTFRMRLHAEDGLARRGHPAFEHFRLVTEGPRGGVPFATLFLRALPANHVPYKLFEVVPGAELRLHGAPGAAVHASVRVRTPTGRSFVWRASTALDAAGQGRLRVPYATDTELPTRPEGPLELEVGDARHRVDITDADVRGGRTLEVGAGAD